MNDENADRPNRSENDEWCSVRLKYSQGGEYSRRLKLTAKECRADENPTL